MPRRCATPDRVSHEGGCESSCDPVEQPGQDVEAHNRCQSTRQRQQGGYEQDGSVRLGCHSEDSQRRDESYVDGLQRERWSDTDSPFE